ncbi:DUF5381 family protein [Paenibacillus turpanensis]|uniref:DUF5381 family protein n=1 Tax=Paenibacillus turpanensis TaxID=2689078 RepID=UPI001409BE26|nr:DUF5381 family protein [Paenibacillus turpanensis]
MNDNEIPDIYKATIKPTPQGAKMEYTNYGAGCMVFAMALLLGASFFCLYIAAESSFFRALTGILIGTVGVLFFGPIAVKLVLSILGGRVLLEYDGEYLAGRKGVNVRASEIKHMLVGRHFRNLFVSEDLVVKTQDGRVHVFRLNNLLSIDAVMYFCDTYLTPKCGVSPERSKVA